MEDKTPGKSTQPCVTKLLQKVPTYIRGLDEILQGGIPKERTTLLWGESGSGKTVLGTEMIFRAASRGEPGVILSFEESPQTLRRNFSTMGWDLLSLEDQGKLFLMEGRIDHRALVEGRFGLEPLMAIIRGKAAQMGAKRVFLDAPDVLLGLLHEPASVRAQLCFLVDWLAGSGLTTLMTLKPRGGGGFQAFTDFFESMTDCIIALDARVRNQVTTRRMRVVKYRGSGFGHNEYPFVITAGGVRTIPITAVQLGHRPSGERLSSGVERLDGLLGGGFFKGSSVLIAGEPGTGKSILASSFVREACQRGEKVLYVTFEESEDALVKNVASAGIDLSIPRERGLLRFLCTMPESTGTEEHLLMLVDQVEGFCPEHVVVDAISACPRMGGPQAAFDYLMRMLNFLKERGITILMVNQTAGTRQQLEISGNGISSMIDTVVFFSYVHGDGETNRAIQVLKSRGSSHSNQVRECVITDNGIEVLEPYGGLGGALTGTARRIQEAKEDQERRRLEAKIQRRQREIAKLKATMEAQMASLRADIENAEWELACLKAEKDRAERERIERLGTRQDGPKTRME